MYDLESSQENSSFSQIFIVIFCLLSQETNKSINSNMVSEPLNMSNQTNTTSSSICINFIQPVKLDQLNYLLWKVQVRVTIIANRLEGFINGNSVCPECNLTEPTRESIRSGAQASLR